VKVQVPWGMHLIPLDGNNFINTSKSKVKYGVENNAS
jgi:hypothetical protein